MKRKKEVLKLSKIFFRYSFKNHSSIDIQGHGSVFFTNTGSELLLGEVKTLFSIKKKCPFSHNNNTAFINNGAFYPNTVRVKDFCLGCVYHAAARADEQTQE